MLSKYNISSQSNHDIFLESLQKHLGSTMVVLIWYLRDPQLENWSFPLGHIHRARQEKLFAADIFSIPQQTTVQPMRELYLITCCSLCWAVFSYSSAVSTFRFFHRYWKYYCLRVLAQTLFSSRSHWSGLLQTDLTTKWISCSILSPTLQTSTSTPSLPPDAIVEIHQHCHRNHDHISHYRPPRLPLQCHKLTWRTCKALTKPHFLQNF